MMKIPTGQNSYHGALKLLQGKISASGDFFTVTKPMSDNFGVLTMRRFKKNYLL